MFLRLLLSLLLVVWLIPSLAFGQNQKQVGDPKTERLLLEEKIAQLTSNVKALEAKQAKLMKELKDLEVKRAILIASAEEKARLILAEAKTRAVKIRADAEAETARFSNLVKEADLELYRFLKDVNFVKRILEEKGSVFQIPSDSKLLDLVFERPRSSEKSDRSEQFKRIWQKELTPLIKEGLKDGRIIILDRPGAQALEIIPLHKKLLPKK